MVSVSAASGRTVVVGLAYALGSCVVLLVLALAGRRLTVQLRGPGLSRALGAVMVLTAVAMAFQLDIRFQTAIADHLPAALVNPTLARALERVSDKLADAAAAVALRERVDGAEDLDDYGAAPDFVGNDRWFNSKPLTLAALRGPRRPDRLLDLHVHQLHPHAAAPGRVGQGLPRRRADDRRRPLARVQLREEGVQRRARDQAERHRVPGRPGQRDGDLERLEQPVLAREVPDRRPGHVRYVHFGEGDYDKTEAAIRALLAEAGDEPGAKPRRTEYDPSAQATPETYLGAARAERFLPGIQQPGTATYTPYDGSLPESHFTLGGRWKVDDESATAGPGATLRGNVTGKDVYLVLSGPGTSTCASTASASRPSSDTQKLYHLLSRPEAGRARPAAAFSPGVSGLRVHVRL